MGRPATGGLWGLDGPESAPPRLRDRDRDRGRLPRPAAAGHPGPGAALPRLRGGASRRPGRAAAEAVLAAASLLAGLLLPREVLRAGRSFVSGFLFFFLKFALFGCRL